LKTCINCQRFYVPLRKGRCGACDMYFRKYGKERGSDQKPTNPAHVCPRCGDAKDRRAEYCRHCRLILSGDNFKTHKTCRGCQQSFPIDEFAWRPTERGIPKRRSRCRACESDYAKMERQTRPPEVQEEKQKKKKAWNQANPHRVRRCHFRRMWKRLGFDPDTIESLYRNRPSSCEICGRTDKLVLDHCHRTNKLRGFLCNRCNLSIGKMGDDPQILIAAANYLIKHSAHKS
jgi:hypothetical protein